VGGGGGVVVLGGWGGGGVGGLVGGGGGTSLLVSTKLAGEEKSPASRLPKRSKLIIPLKTKKKKKKKKGVSETRRGIDGGGIERFLIRERERRPSKNDGRETSGGRGMTECGGEGRNLGLDVSIMAAHALRVSKMKCASKGKENGGGGWMC